MLGGNLMNSKNLFLEIEHHLLKDDKPSLFLNQIRKETTFKDSPFNIFNQFTDENKDYKQQIARFKWTTML